MSAEKTMNGKVFVLNPAAAVLVNGPVRCLVTFHFKE